MSTRREYEAHDIAEASDEDDSDEPEEPANRFDYSDHHEEEESIDSYEKAQAEIINRGVADLMRVPSPDDGVDIAGPKMLRLTRKNRK